jgi:hypothetical protein
VQLLQAHRNAHRLARICGNEAPDRSGRCSRVSTPQAQEQFDRQLAAAMKEL